MKNLDDQKSAKRLIFRIWPILVLALLPFIPLWRCVFLGQAIGPFDQIAQMAPWHAAKATQPWDVLQADGVLQFYPWRDMVFKAWGHGQLPLWNPYELAGTPLLGNSQSAAFYPPHVILGLLHVPTQLGMTLLAWFHLFWAGLGTFLLARRFGASKEGALIAGASFELSAFMIAWTGLPSVITTVAWIPWLLAGIKGVYDSHPLRAAVLRSEREGLPSPASAEEVSVIKAWAQVVAARSLISHRKYLAASTTVAISAGMMVLAGHLQFAAYGFMGAALLAVWLLIESFIESRDAAKDVTAHTMRVGTSDALRTQKGFPLRSQPWFGSSFRIVLAMLLGVAIAAPQLLPVLSYSQFSHRKASPTEEGYSDYQNAAIQLDEFVGLVYPKLVGDPGAWVPDLDTSPELPGYWPQYNKPGANFAEGAVSIGPVVMLLLCTLPFRKKAWRKALPMALVGFAGLLLATGTRLTRITYFAIPGWSSTGSPGRAIVLFVLAACVVAAFSIEDDGNAGEMSLKKLAPVGLFLAVSVAFILIVKTALDAIPSYYPALTDSFGKIIQLADREPLKASMLVAILTAAGGVLWLARGRKGVWALIVLVIIAPALLLSGILRFGNPDSLATTGPSDERIGVINSNWDIASAVPALLPPNTAAISGLHELGGYDSLLHTDTKAMLDWVNGKNSTPLANGNMIFVKPSADPTRLASAGVTQIWSLKEIPQFGTPATTENGIFKYSLDGPGRASTPAGPAKILSETYTQLKVVATGPGRLVVRDRNMPGWIAKIDGKHVPIEGTLWRELDLPAGDHVVEFNYVPPGLMTGIYLAVPAWLILLGCSIFAQRRRPTTSQPETPTA